MGHFLQKSPIIDGLLAGNDLKLEAFYAFSQLSTGRAYTHFFDLYRSLSAKEPNY